VRWGEEVRMVMKRELFFLPVFCPNCHSSDIVIYTKAPPKNGVRVQIRCNKCRMEAAIVEEEGRQWFLVVPWEDNT
jgi:ribosomal protein S27E